MARDIGSSLLSGFQTTFNRGDPLKDKLLASTYNDQRNVEISRRNSDTITDIEMSFVRQGGGEGKSVADIKGTDLIADQSKLPPGGMAEFLNSSGMNVTFGAGPNMAFSSVSLGKDEHGEPAVLLKVASIEKEQDEKGRLNIRARRNWITDKGTPEAEGGEPIAIPIDEFNTLYNSYKRNAAQGAGNEHLIKHLDPGGAAYKSGILEPAVIEDPNKIGSVDLNIIEEVREANKKAVAEQKEIDSGKMVESEGAESRIVDQTVLEGMYDTQGKEVPPGTPMGRTQIMDDIFVRKGKMKFDASTGTSVYSKGPALSEKYENMLDHSGGKELPLNFTQEDWNESLSENDRTRIKKAVKNNTLETFNNKIDTTARALPNPFESEHTPGTTEEHKDRVGAFKLFNNGGERSKLMQAFYKDKGLYGEFLDNPEEFAKKYSDDDGKFMNWKEPKPERKVVKELAELSKKIENPDLKKALNSGNTAKITELLQKHGTAQENLSQENQQAVVNQLVKQEGQSAYPRSMRAKLMYMMTADMPEERALAWLGGAGGTFIETGQWDRESVANLKNGALTKKERMDRDTKFVDNYKKTMILTGGGGSPTDDEDKIPLDTLLETATEGQWETYGRQAGSLVEDAAERAVLNGHVDGIRTTNRDVRRIFAKTMEWGVQDGVWNSLASLAIFRGMPDRGVLGDDAGNFIAVNEKTGETITDPNKMDPRTTVFWEIDTFGSAQRAGSVGYGKITAALANQTSKEQIMRQMRIIAAQNAKYANLLKQDQG